MKKSSLFRVLTISLAYRKGSRYKRILIGTWYFFHPSINVTYSIVSIYFSFRMYFRIVTWRLTSKVPMLRSCSANFMAKGGMYRPAYDSPAMYSGAVRNSGNIIRNCFKAVYRSEAHCEQKYRILNEFTFNYFRWTISLVAQLWNQQRINTIFYQQ